MSSFVFHPPPLSSPSPSASPSPSPLPASPFVVYVPVCILIDQFKIGLKKKLFIYVIILIS